MVKWSQPPDPYVPDDAFNGWDELSVYGGPQIVADDWYCDTDWPVTDIHWWGSFIGWSEPYIPDMPDAFHIAIWKDVPAGVDAPFSHPGDVIWENYCDTFTWDFVGWDFDPRDPTMAPEATWYFQQDIPEGEWFYQEPGGNIYWVSIAAVYAGTEPTYWWGWKTRPRDPASPAPDDAVRIFDPTDPVVGMTYNFGEPIYWPTQAESWDMAFELTARDTTPPTVINTIVNRNAPNVTPMQNRSRIRELAFQFDEDVSTSLDVTDLTIVEWDPVALDWIAPPVNLAGAVFSYDGTTDTGIWDLSAVTLNNAFYKARLSWPGIWDIAGNPLDGNADGVGGDDFTFKFHKLAGDVSGDAAVNVSDLGILGANYGTSNSWWLLPGDMDLNGTVSVGDLGILGANYGTVLVPPPAGAGPGGGGSMLAGGGEALPVTTQAAALEPELEPTAPPETRGRKDIAHTTPNLRIAWGAAPAAEAHVPAEVVEKLPRVRTDVGAGLSGLGRTVISGEDVDESVDEELVDLLALI
jgi:hypothetical protein